MWCDILKNQIIGPFFIEGTLNGQKYVDFLTNELRTLLKDVPLEYRARMWFQHNGCPARNALIAHNVLNRIFPSH